MSSAATPLALDVLLSLLELEMLVLRKADLSTPILTFEFSIMFDSSTVSYCDSGKALVWVIRTCS